MRTPWIKGNQYSMLTFTFKDVLNSKERFNIYTLMCNPSDLASNLEFYEGQNIPLLNIGKELATYIESLEDYSYLNIEISEYLVKLLDKRKSKVNNSSNEIIAIYNLGILLEPTLELNAVKLLKEFSKSTALIIIWENQFDGASRLTWATQTEKIFLDFSGVQLKRLQNAV